MPSIEDLNKKRAEIERKKREIADRAAERAAKEHEARLAAEGEALDWELEQVKQAEKMQTEARKAEAKGASASTGVSDDEVKRLVAAAKTKAAGGTPTRPKTNGSGGTPTTAAKSEEK